MKSIIKKLCILCLIIPTLTGCLEETFPTSSTATVDQVSGSDAALGAMTNSITKEMLRMGASNDNCGFGYPSMMMWFDVALQDMPVYNTQYNYFNMYMCNTSYLGSYVWQQDVWTFYYALVRDCNLLIDAVDEDNLFPTSKQYFGTALAYRSLAYMDMVRWYEFKHTGTSLDGEAEASGIMKQTIPLVTEETTEEEGRNNPRAPFYKMYRFIINDLNKAEQILAEYQRGEKKNFADVSVIYGLKARFYMELGSRFERYPEDLQMQLSHESDEELSQYDLLNISSATDCYNLAKKYALQAIDCGYSPVTTEQWFEPTSGFNTVNQAWMFAIIMGANDETTTWKTWIGQMSPEQTFGVTHYGAYRLIGASLYNKIPDADWRKATWIDPADASKIPIPAKYRTLLSPEDWAKRPAYTGFKIRPGGGDMGNYLVGTIVDIPLMRVEEMYFIDAEATAYTEGLSAGIQKLESFINQYRYTDGSYHCEATDLDTFIDELLLQKRIEFWGEGILMWDYKRLEKQVIRGYIGTNFVADHRYNSLKGYVAPWMNLFLHKGETQYNLAIVNNPDPSNILPKWTE